MSKLHQSLLGAAAAFWLSFGAAHAAPFDAPDSGQPDAVQSHVNAAYLAASGDVSVDNLPSTLYLINDKVFASPVPAWRAKPHPAATKMFDQFYYLGENWVSAWALNTPEGIVVFDALPTAGEAEQFIEGGLRKLGLDPARIKYVVITHGHADHFGGAKYLQDKYKAHVLMSAVDWDNAAKAATPAAPAPTRDMTITDGQQWKVGATTITFALTPGHTPGTISALIPVTDQGRKHVISFVGGTGLNAVVNPSKGGGKILRDSLLKFAKLSVAANADVVIASHPFLDDSLEKAARRAAVKTGPSPWVATRDGVLRYYVSSIEAVHAIEAYDRLKLAPAGN
jgi:metallo-beta-lactamase class B